MVLTQVKGPASSLKMENIWVLHSEVQFTLIIHQLQSLFLSSWSFHLFIFISIEAIYLSICPSIYLSIYLSIYQYIFQFIYLSLNLPFDAKDLPAKGLHPTVGLWTEGDILAVNFGRHAFTFRQDLFKLQIKIRHSNLLQVHKLNYYTTGQLLSNWRVQWIWRNPSNPLNSSIW